MRVIRVATKQGHPVPSQSYFTAPGSFNRDPHATEVGSKGAIPRHLLGEGMSWNPEIIVNEPEEELTGTAANGWQEVQMMRCMDCGEIVASTKTQDHNCEPIPTYQP